MPLNKLVFKPGINRDQTNYSTEGGWYACDKIRFRSGFPEKIGGWTVPIFESFDGVCRSLFPYVTSTEVPILGMGTNEKVYVQLGTALYNISPQREFTTPDTNDCFTTGTAGSTTVTVTIADHLLDNGDTVVFSGVVGPIDGIPQSEFNSTFTVANVTANTFTITVTTPCTTGGVTGGGTAIVAKMDVLKGNAVLVQGFGWGAGAWGRGGWGSGSVLPVYSPARQIFQDNFNNDLVFNYRDETGEELYGVPGYNQTNIFIWDYSGTLSNRAVPLSDVAGAIAVPQQVGQILFAPSGHLLALSCTNYDATNSANDYLGAYDPLLIRWSSVSADFGPQPEVWRPNLETGTAGFLRIQSGSRIICGVRARQEVLVFTDFSLTSLQFTNTLEVFSTQELFNNLSIMGPNVVANANNIVYWMGVDKFYMYNGRVDTLPCTLRQYIFQDINFELAPLFFSGTNGQYNEVIWFYASANANDIDRYVIYNYQENIWYYGNLHRTAWTDAGYVVYPYATANNWLYQHEIGNDDGQPLGAPPLPIEAYIQSADFDIEDGDKFMLIRRLIPDVNFNGSETFEPISNQTLTPEAQVTVGVRNFPGAVSSVTNASGNSLERNVTTTVTIDQYTNQVFLRARGRQMNFKISSDNLGTQWQLGMPRIDAREDGRRG